MNATSAHRRTTDPNIASSAKTAMLSTIPLNPMLAAVGPRSVRHQRLTAAVGTPMMATAR